MSLQRLKKVPSGFIHNSPKLVAAHVSISRVTDTSTRVYLYHHKLLHTQPRKRKQNTRAVYNYTDESQNHYAEAKKPFPKKACTI